MCREETREGVDKVPTEDCSLEPQEDCRMETVLVPRYLLEKMAIITTLTPQAPAQAKLYKNSKRGLCGVQRKP